MKVLTFLANFGIILMMISINQGCGPSLLTDGSDASDSIKKIQELVRKDDVSKIVRDFCFDEIEIGGNTDFDPIQKIRKNNEKKRVISNYLNSGVYINNKYGLPKLYKHRDYILWKLEEDDYKIINHQSAFMWREIEFKRDPLRRGIRISKIYQEDGDNFLSPFFAR